MESPDAASIDSPPSNDAPSPDGMEGCEAGYQDEDQDGTCKLGCEGTGANDALNCGPGGTCEIDAAGDRGCTCADGYEGTFCETCASGYERVGADCVLDLPPTTNLALWLDADSTASLTVSSNRVASWADRRGGASPITLAQTAPSARPGYNATGHAGRGAVVFDGDDQLFVNSFSGLSGADYEVIVALNPLGSGAKGIASLASATTEWGMLLEQPANGGDYVVTHRGPIASSGGVTAMADRTNAPGSGWVSATYQSSQAIDTLAIFASDGATSVTNVASASGTGSIGSPYTFRVGRSQNGFMAGEILEVLVYEQRLSVTQRAEVTDYLRAKWNLP
ncbi:MAG: hypothetical protein SFX73_21520 [Kofleriaceae bacterium]|nr:hypothetical protein [Kofleriaceae bacterium]